MRRLTRVVSTLSGAPLCSPAWAVRWVSLGNSTGCASELLVGVFAPRIGGDIRSTWTRRVLAPRAEKGSAHYLSTLVTR